ncbi:Hypp9662 [Branchiostoma lanceolatum]|uniref:Hypp9662 protein n=1 Tax=Branchiostoma lanceolatum TaxID=7740 RepID=A0A8S4MNW8_BRALA|nr:Hypp9662 [Branchiostoma lanceolatum]
MYALRSLAELQVDMVACLRQNKDSWYPYLCEGVKSAISDRLVLQVDMVACLRQNKDSWYPYLCEGVKSAISDHLVDMVACLRQNKDSWYPYLCEGVDMVACLRQNKDSPYLYVNGVLHTWEGEEQRGRHCNITDCHRHGPKHPQFTGLERHPHDFIVVGLDLDPKEPLHETYPDPKPPPGRDRLIGRLQRLNAGPYVPHNGPGSKHDYSLEVEAIWQRYFTGL